MKTAYECLPCTSSELAAIKGCTVKQAAAMLYALKVEGLAVITDNRIPGDPTHRHSRWERARDRQQYTNKKRARMIPVRSKYQWYCVYREIFRKYNLRSRQSVIERATRFTVT